MGSNLLTKVRKCQAGLKNVGDAGLPMRFRLFIFFLVFLIFIMCGVLIILMASGIFNTGSRESHSFMEHELSGIAERINYDFSMISVHSVDLARRLSADLEGQFMQHGITAESMYKRPDLLEELLEGELKLLTDALEKTRSSGVFFILDVTVNPELEGAEYSRAGLFIKNMEPNIVSSSFSNLRFLRGPMTIARKNKMDVLPQWEMEFNVQTFEGFNRTIETAQNSTQSLSRLYYWYGGMSIANSSETAMFCCVPLIDSNGNVFGVSGFEVSSMLFKLSYSPDYTKYANIFCIFSPVENGKLVPMESFIAGNFRPPLSTQPLSIGNAGLFNTYQQDDIVFSGLHQYISLYPSNSAYHQQWLFSLMMPEQDLAQIISGQNRKIFAFLVLLMVISVAISLLVSRRYTKPVEDALGQLKTEKISQVSRTGIPEIDDLITFLAEQDEVTDLGPDIHGNISESPLFSRFVESIETLSAAERAVFNLYVKGYTAPEIADILCLSINTIKTHNKRIYMKLNVSSRKELMLYIQMLEEQKGLNPES